MNKADSMGFYDSLNISHRASQDEIRLAYVMLKQANAQKGKTPPPKVQEAYETLRDPKQRKVYDAGPESAFNVLKRSDGTSRLNSVPLLISLSAVLVLALIITVGPMIKVHFTEYAVGDQLYWTASSRPFGSVVTFEEKHAFPDGVVMPAYQVRPASGGILEWHSAKDLHRHTAPTFD